MNKAKHIRVIIAGGGTGGHIFPAVSIANALRRLQPECQLLFVGAKGKMEMEKVPKEGYEIVGLDIAGFDRSSLLKNIFLPYKLIKSFMQARSVLSSFKPDVVVGVGGYASFPVLYMAQQRGISTLLQEQNSFAGKSNKILGKKASSICVAYPDMDRFFPKERILHTGNPVRKSITENSHSKQEGLAFFKLNPTQKVIFAFGGSLGAKSINETLIKQFTTLVEGGVQLIWQTGSSFFDQAKRATAAYESSVKVFDFIREIDFAYAAADVIISRAGASSISELCIVGKPVVFVPFPYASEDHQTHNAMALVNVNAALMVKNSDTEQELVAKAMSLINNEALSTELSKNSKELSITDADTRIANRIIQLANQ